ncbi:VMAP-C domain-containing protein [Lentzea flava]|uniref:TIR domain-containing protein n=1 Tax=Lentzea flava TaxID=103732 RepID=A0ABQ2URX8_9PSEU|nr:hypothetical protein [Lentzea flava]MCP2197194.1 hypothetical protein [Lentzea flava]GGU50719.1 hypothetical protein GCM10010178_49580 [Lentzea flava]
MPLAEQSAESGALWPLVEVLRRIPCLMNRSGRNLVMRMVCEELGEQLPFEEHDHATGHLYSLAEVCRTHPDGLPALVLVLERIEQRSRQMVALRETVRAMTAPKLWASEESARLFQLLEGAVLPDITEIYHAVVGLAAPRLSAQATHVEVLRALESLNADANGIPKPLVFVEHLAMRVRPELATELRRWSDRQAAHMGLSAELVAVRRAAAESDHQAERPPRSLAYLVLQVQREGPSGDRYRLSHWRQLGQSTGWAPVRGADVVGELELVKDRVAALIEQIEVDWGQYRPNIRIEFVLPGEFINLDVDQWPWETDSLIPEPIGCRYPVVVRSLERMARRKWYRLWHERWEQLLLQLRKTGAVHRESAWWGKQDTEQGLRELTSALARTTTLVSLVLSAPPRVEMVGRDEVAAGLRAGVPLILWHRENCGDAEFKAVVESLLHGDDDPHDLLERVRLARVTAFERGAVSGHVGEKLTILLDDPVRVVVPSDPAPPERMSVA